MSVSKDWMAKEEYYHDLAEEILLRLKVIGRCEMHSDFLYQNFVIDEQEKYAQATSILKKEHPEDNDYKLFHAQIKKILDGIYATSADECPYCQKMWEE